MLTHSLDVPARHPHFVGRQAELRRLERSFEHLALLALEGRAGSGKTALALELANRRREANPDRPWLWMRVRAGASVESLQLELARRWQAAAAPAELPLHERLLWLARALNSQAATLVLDDFHLLGDGQLLLEPMREYLHHGRLLLTTRQALELPGAARADSTVLRLDALEMPESRRLLRQLLDHHELGGWLEKAHFSALLEAGRGQPLLLKLLVSLLLQNRRATLEDIASFQDELYTDLVAELETQLQPDERRTLRTLALFRHPVPASALGQGAGKLSLLSDRLLVERGPGATWTTHDVFGDVYERTLEEREARELHAACAEYCQGLSSDPGLAREAIHHLLKAGQEAKALALLVERGTSLSQAAHYDLLLALTSRLEDCQEPEATALRILRAEVLAMVGRTPEALPLFTEAEQGPDPQLAIRAMNSRCHLLLERGDLEEAQAIAGRALERLEGMSGRRPGRVKALNAMALAQARRGQATPALRTCEISLRISAEIQDAKGACYAHYAASLAHRHCDDWENALRQARLAREEAEKAGETRLGFLAGFVEVMALLEGGQAGEGHRLAEQAYERSLSYPDPLSQAMAAGGRALSSLAAERTEPGIALLESAIAKAMQHGGKVFLAQLHLSLGVAYQKAGKDSLARAEMKKGLSLAQACDAFPLEAELELRLGLLDGRPAVAELRYARAEKDGLHGLSARLRLALAAAERARGRDRSARECLHGLDLERLVPCEQAFAVFLRALLDGVNLEPPCGAWRELAVALLGSEGSPYRVTTGQGPRAVSQQELARWRASSAEYDLFVDLPGQRVLERERGELPLLKRKVLVRMLLALLRAGGEPLTQEELYGAVWEGPYDPESGGPQVRKNVSALRDLLEPDRNNPRYLLAREGTFARKGGYLWSPERSFCLIEES